MSTTVPAGSLRPARTTTVAVGDVEVTLNDHDRTRPFLVLHGGGGVATVRGFADLLADRTHSPGAGSHPPRLRRHRPPGRSGFDP